MGARELDLGKRIRETREGLGLTQAQVAEALKIPRPSVSQLERGKREIRMTELESLARLFCQEPGDFFRGPDSRWDDSVASPLIALLRAEPSLSDEDHREGLHTALRVGREMARLENLLHLPSRASRVCFESLYPIELPRSKGDAIRQGEALAEKERKRLDLGVAPIRDVADLLESQGIRTAWIDLPNDISGMTLRDREAGVLVVVNRSHPLVRRRFSYSHEYGHVLLDADQPASISHETQRADLREVRANSFAAAFLMPEEGAREYLLSLGKDRKNRRLFLHEIALFAHHFGVSRPAALFRLQNLSLLGREQALDLRDQNQAGLGRHAEELLEKPDRKRDERDSFRLRFLGLALEAYRRDKISRGKLRELADLIDFGENEIERFLDRMGVEVALEGHLPEGLA